jgi:opacity protein-like surface antigen
MVRRNASIYKQFSLLSLSLLAGAAYAQENSDVAQEATAIPEALVSSPVTSAMTATTVPVQSTEAVSSKLIQSPAAEAAQSSSSAAASDLESAVAESVEPSMSTSKNANKDGTQIIINNNQKSDLDSDLKNDNANSATNTSESGADLLRRERLRTELKNEGRLLEKIEEDRVNTELKRSESIEGINLTGITAAKGADLQTAQVTAVAVDGNATAQVFEVPNTSTVALGDSVSLSSARHSSGKLSLSAGYRWMPYTPFMGYDVQNMGFFSGAIETKLGTAMALEGSFGYGRDRITTPFYGMTPGFQDPFYYARSRDVFEFSANMKLGYLKGTFQPFVLGGVGAVHQRYNIDDFYTLADADYAGWSRSSTRLVGNLGAGVDFAMNSNIGFGLRYEWNYIFNKHYNPMNDLYGDSSDRMKIVGSMQISF